MFLEFSLGRAARIMRYLGSSNFFFFFFTPLLMYTHILRISLCDELSFSVLLYISGARETVL